MSDAGSLNSDMDVETRLDELMAEDDAALASSGSSSTNSSASPDTELSLRLSPAGAPPAAPAPTYEPLADTAAAGPAGAAPAAAPAPAAELALVLHASAGAPYTVGSNRAARPKAVPKRRPRRSVIGETADNVGYTPAQVAEVLGILPNSQRRLGHVADVVEEDWEG